MIDARAVLSPGARVAADVTIGPYAIIDDDVEIGAGTVVDAHVIIRGPTHIGRDNHFHAFSVIGGAPQDKKYRSEPTMLRIGNRNTFREHCTVNRGTTQGGGSTRIGDDNWLMANVHIAHDCDIGNATVMANNTALAGHVTIEDHVILGGFTAVHQFCRIGAYSFTAIAAAVTKDVPPYMMVAGNTASTRGLNREGLKRHGFNAATIDLLKRAYRILYRSGLTLTEAMEQLRGMAADSVELQRLIDFIDASERGITR